MKLNDGWIFLLVQIQRSCSPQECSLFKGREGKGRVGIITFGPIFLKKIFFYFVAISSFLYFCVNFWARHNILYLQARSMMDGLRYVLHAILDDVLIMSGSH